MKKLYLQLFIISLLNGVGFSQSWEAVGQGLNSLAYCMTIYNGELVVGGQFTVAGGQPASKLAKWNGTSWSSFTGEAFDGTVKAAYVWNGKLYVGGHFEMIGVNSIEGVAVWDGVSWSALGSGLNGNSNWSGTVRGFTEYNGELVVCGDFEEAGGVNANDIATWNGTTWSAIGSGLYFEDIWYLKDVHVFNSELYAGGTNSNTMSNIAKWNGASWIPLSIGAESSIGTIESFNGELYVGGDFSAIGGITASGIAKWDGTNFSPLGVGVSSYVRNLKTINGKLIVSGSYSSSGGTTCGNISSWDGASFNCYAQGLSAAVEETIEYNGQLYSCGWFNQDLENANTMVGIARWSGLLSTESISSTSETISVYPSPATDFVEVNSEHESIIGYNVLNSAGQVHINLPIDHINYCEINVSMLDPGVYILQVELENHSIISKRFVKN